MPLSCSDTTSRWGHGREGIFRYLDEFDIGSEIGRSVRYGKPEEREGAVEALILELCLFS